MGRPTTQTENFDKLVNSEAIAADLDRAKEGREAARIKIAAYQQKVAQGYNRSVYLRSFKLDDLVLQKVVVKNKNKKLMPNWEGPFCVVKHLGSGNKKLEKIDGTPIAKSWNAKNLGGSFIPKTPRQKPTPYSKALLSFDFCTWRSFILISFEQNTKNAVVYMSRFFFLKLQVNKDSVRFPSDNYS